MRALRQPRKTRRKKPRPRRAPVSARQFPHGRAEPSPARSRQPGAPSHPRRAPVSQARSSEPRGAVHARSRQSGSLLRAARSRRRRAPGSLREAGQICAARPLVATGFPGAPGLRGFSPAAPALALAGAPRTRPWGRALSAERE